MLPFPQLTPWLRVPLALRRAYAALISSSARFRAAADGMTDALYIFDAVRTNGRLSDFRLVEINQVALSRVDTSRDDVVGKLSVARSYVR
jgi:PAS domain-containing protein